MTAPRVRANYDELRQIAQVCGQQAEAGRRMLSSMQKAKAVLQDGGWVGRGATVFYEEMESAVLPTQELGEAICFMGEITHASL